MIYTIRNLASAVGVLVLLMFIFNVLITSPLLLPIKGH